MTTRQFPCTNCGADVEFDPGASALKCPYCGVENKIPQSEDDVEELDFRARLAQLEGEAETVESATVVCGTCGARSTLDENIASDECPFCGSNVVQKGGTLRRIKPRSLLPFKVTEREASDSFRSWLKALWFAPNKLKRLGRSHHSINGLYVPYWTYDCKTMSFYRGQRGDDYYVTQTYMTTVGGRSVMRTRQVRRTRWRNVSGTVWNKFDDLLVLASRSLPSEYVEKLEPWDLSELTPYDDQYLSGFRAESYQVDLAEGFEKAKGVMDGVIHASVRRDIGGDHQRISLVKTRHDNVTFKHLLLPIWLSAYRFKQKVYRFLVNARTGEVQGERPWSWAKIALTILGGVTLILTGVLLFIWYKN